MQLIFIFFQVRPATFAALDESVGRLPRPVAAEEESGGGVPWAGATLLDAKVLLEPLGGGALIDEWPLGGGALIDEWPLGVFGDLHGSLGKGW